MQSNVSLELVDPFNLVAGITQDLNDSGAGGLVTFLGVMLINVEPITVTVIILLWWFGFTLGALVESITIKFERSVLAPISHLSESKPVTSD